MNARFARQARVELTPDGPDLLVRINGEMFVWPRDASVDDLVWVVSELAMPDHPHQYLWGQTQIKPGDVVLDIGSCEGSFAVLAVEKGAKVIAVEPSAKMQRIIRRLFECRGRPLPQIVGCALGASAGAATLEEDESHPGYARMVQTSDAQAGTVPVMSLDQLTEQLPLPRVDFIKCDAEGADLDIVRGGCRTLRRDHPRLAICTYHADDHYNKLHELLSSLGYHVQGKGFLHAPGKFRVLMLHAW